MPLKTTEIRTILGSNGKIVFPSKLGEVEAGSKLIDRGIVDEVVQYNYTKIDLTVDTVTNTIIMTRVANDSTTNNGVNIRTEDRMAMVGKVNIPGYVYTGDFSGCVFYLYKTGPAEVTGVHAYSGSQPVTTTTGPFWNRKKVINQVVREFGPKDYFTRNPGREICRHETRGEIDILGGETSLGFLSCVEMNSATTFLYAVKGSKEGYNVVRLLKEYTDAV